MYYPIQAPYLLNSEFLKHVDYQEKRIALLDDFLICLWSMTPKTTSSAVVNNVIAFDGCIDLVISPADKMIIFAGMSQTIFDDPMELPANWYGFRLKPGAFHALTGLDANLAMDKTLHLHEFDKDFDYAPFFELDFDGQQRFLVNYLATLGEKSRNVHYLSLFDELWENDVLTTVELAEKLGLNIRQMQRVLAKKFGLSPQKILNVVRFQKCISGLMSGSATPDDILAMTAYYDQSHFIKDFKRYIGLTPFEFLKICKNGCREFTIQTNNDMVKSESNRKVEQKMIYFEPSIAFKRDCNDALEMYKKAFDAKIIEKIRWSDGMETCATEDKDLIYYSQIKIGKQKINMADDSNSVLASEKTYSYSQGINLLMHFDSDTDLKKAFDILSDGAEIKVPIESGKWWTSYAVLVDKFGIMWEFMAGYKG